MVYTLNRMKKILYIIGLSLFFPCILFFSTKIYAAKTTLTSYYPSPNGTYTMIQLKSSQTGQPNQNPTVGSTPYCFCAQNSNNTSGINGSLCDTGELNV